MESIHERALYIAGQFKKFHTELIDIIQEVDSKKAFYERECTSTFDYCVKFLKLSDNISLDLIAIARKAKTVPDLKKAIQEEVITISKARRLTSVITQDNSSHWIGLAQTLSKDKLEKEIAKVNPQILTQEKSKYVAENRLKLELGVSEEIMGDLKRAQEILSQKQKRNISFEGAIGEVLKDFLKREDPVKKAKRSLIKIKKETVQSLGAMPRENEIRAETNSSLLGPGRVQLATARRIPFKAQLKHEINLRDDSQCTYVDLNNQRCLERKWLQFHHIEPVKNGGPNNLENLTTLCYGHHKMEHLNS